jgi:predicted TPR repeat methyltransferase
MQGRHDVSVATSEPAKATTLTLAEATVAGIRLLSQNRLAQAESLLQAVVDADAENADALHFLGLLRAQQGRGDDAIELIRRALNANPQYADAWNNFGLLLRAMPHYSAALDAFDKAAAHGPNLISAHLNRAQLLRRSARFDEAASAYRRVLELDPTHTDAHRALGNLLYRMGRLEEAAEAYENWSRIDPNHPVAAHMAAAHRAGAAPSRASGDYVRATFDRFAPAFDQNMTALKYHAPQLVLEEVAKCFEPMRELDILDAGCGTGLCGPMLAPFAQKLFGIDLSSAMVDLAAKREVYDALVVAELTEYLEANPDAFDLIVSADTLVYFGALEELIAAAARSLREAGILVFTVERLRESSRCDQRRVDFFLNPHGRYSHAEEYLRRCLAGAAFELVNLRPDTLRFENDLPVEGFVLTARKL